MRKGQTSREVVHCIRYTTVGSIPGSRGLPWPYEDCRGQDCFATTLRALLLANADVHVKVRPPFINRRRHRQHGYISIHPSSIGDGTGGTDGYILMYRLRGYGAAASSIDVQDCGRRYRVSGGLGGAAGLGCIVRRAAWGFGARVSCVRIHACGRDQPAGAS